MLVYFRYVCFVSDFARVDSLLLFISGVATGVVLCGVALRLMVHAHQMLLSGVLVCIVVRMCFLLLLAVN